MFSKLFGRRPAAREEAATHGSLDDAGPVAGNIYAFHTMPTNEFGAPETGRWAAVKVLGKNEALVVVAVSDGIWNSLPSLQEVGRSSILREHRFAFTGRLAVFGIIADGWSPSGLDQLTLLGAIKVSSEHKSLAEQILGRAVGSRTAGMWAANHAAEGEWRWTHDREAFSEEIERQQAKAAEQRAAQEKRYRERLSKLTWDQLLAETPFQRWTPSPPFPPAEFTAEAREVIHATCKKLEALGAKPKKADVRAALKSCVEWFNAADESAGGVIETEEREDIFAVLEEMAHVARQKNLVEEIDAWRDW
ncbi:hypothetical protein [Phenylobacterium montanum]|uniref:Uncharacterized protein n=1 Tax=Phenylobacterium montanum TaxID=2823693 RepID=A0A975G1M3_9CAUL|nr:hypothetical protein [Caulobacter sp. S6]QUD88912.1 hypothetical protein KCG34_03215 [Caulobacter sp. S6]